MSHVFRMLLAVLLLGPASALAQGDPQAFTDAYAKCMQYKPQNATDCYDHSCAFQGCIAQYSSVMRPGGAAIADPSLREAAVPACMPHIQAMQKCIREHGLINPPPPPDSGGLALSCAAGDNSEGGCCCFNGSHTYLFAPRQVGAANVTFDTGRGLDCQSLVRIRVRVDGAWQVVGEVSATSSAGGSERAPIRQSVPVGRVIDGLMISDGCVCCIDDSRVELN